MINLNFSEYPANTYTKQILLLFNKKIECVSLMSCCDPSDHLNHTFFKHFQANCTIYKVNV